jgi:hypothetical protein
VDTDFTATTATRLFEAPLSAEAGDVSVFFPGRIPYLYKLDRYDEYDLADLADTVS